MNPTPVRLAREKAGITQSELSRRSGVDVTALNRIESGCQRAGPKSAKRIAEALGVAVETIAPHLKAEGTR